jgi:hypothetical protein
MSVTVLARVWSVLVLTKTGRDSGEANWTAGVAGTTWLSSSPGPVETAEGAEGGVAGCS